MGAHTVVEEIVMAETNIIIQLNDRKLTRDDIAGMLQELDLIHLRKMIQTSQQPTTNPRKYWVTDLIWPANYPPREECEKRIAEMNNEKIHFCEFADCNIFFHFRIPWYIFSYEDTKKGASNREEEKRETRQLSETQSISSRESSPPVQRSEV